VSPKQSIQMCMGLLAIALMVEACAQVVDVDSALDEGISGEAGSELGSQADAQTPQTDNRQELGVFYHKRGVANLRLGNYSRAVEDLRLALGNSSEVAPEEWGRRWRVQSDLGDALRYSGDLLAAIEYQQGIAREYQKRNLGHYFTTQSRLAAAYSELGEFVSADQALQEVNRTLPRLRNLANWSDVSANRIFIHSNINAFFLAQQGKYADAERHYRLSLDAAEREVDFVNRSYPKGDQRIRVATLHVAYAKTKLASVLATLGKYGEAEFYARSALADYRGLLGSNTVMVSKTLGAIGLNKLQQGDAAAAQRYYRRAVSALEGSGVMPHATQLASRRAGLANAFVAQSRWREAIDAFDQRDQALRSNSDQAKRLNSDNVGWALALHKSGQPLQAREMVERMLALETKHPVPNRNTVARLRGVLGITQSALGNTENALAAFQQAIPELTRLDQDDASSENSGYLQVFWRRVVLEGYLDLLAKLHVAKTPGTGLDVPDEAFRMADLARGSSVQQAIAAVAVRARLPDGSLAELARQDQDALNRIGALNVVLGRLAAAPENETFKQLIARRRAEIDSLRATHTALQAEIRRRSPEYAELIDPRPAELADIRRALAPNEALVALYLGESQAYVWTLGSEDKSAFRVIDLTRASIEADVATLRNGLEFGGGGEIPTFDLVLAAKLYQVLLAPDAPLWKSARILNVIPHGALAQLPLGLLVTMPPTAGTQTTYKNAAWLVRQVALAQLPSATAFVALRRTPPPKANRQAFIGFGDPIFAAGASPTAQRSSVRNLRRPAVTDPTDTQLDAPINGAPSTNLPAAAIASLAEAFRLLPALPDTAEELKDIAATLKADAGRDVYLGRAANETNVKQPGKIDNHRVVAFATHGIVPGELIGLDQPALALSNPALTGERDQDGFLTMEEVLGLKLDADWVVLSACNTASGEGKSSEAVSGLGRAFFFAGAHSLLVSNWAVETNSARLLTTGTFKWQAEDPALTRAEALRLSMLALMDKSEVGAPRGSVTSNYAHPVFWAPFSLVGDSGAVKAPR
jgi:CHAT domain-containing protein